MVEHEALSCWLIFDCLGLGGLAMDEPGNGQAFDRHLTAEKEDEKTIEKKYGM